MDALRDRLGIEGNPLDYTLFTVAGTPISIVTIVVFLGVLVAALVASGLAQRAVVRALRARKIDDAGTLAVARRLLHYAILGIGLAIGLQTIGIHLGALFAAGAVFAIGLGFAMQNIMQNFVSGLILLIERSITPGDVLRIDDRIVRVETMGIRATIARTLDDEEVIIPNSSIVQSNVTNYTLEDSRYRLRVSVGVTYDSDMRQVRAVLEETARGVDWRLPDRDPVVLLSGFGASSVDWEVSVWTDDPWTVRSARSALYEAVWWALKDAGITIAFPQLDVHFDEPLLRAIERAS